MTEEEKKRKKKLEEDNNNRNGSDLLNPLSPLNSINTIDTFISSSPSISSGFDVGSSLSNAGGAG